MFCSNILLWKFGNILKFDRLTSQTHCPLPRFHYWHFKKACCLFIWNAEVEGQEREKERKNECPVCWFTSERPPAARTEPHWRQLSGKYPADWATTCCFPGHAAAWSWKSGMEPEFEPRRSSIQCTLQLSHSGLTTVSLTVKTCKNFLVRISIFGAVVLAQLAKSPVQVLASFACTVGGQMIGFVGR